MLLETTSKKNVQFPTKSHLIINSLIQYVDPEEFCTLKIWQQIVRLSLLNFLLIIPPYNCLISFRQIQAFIYDASPLQFQVGIDKNCQLMLVGKPYAMSGYAVAFPKGQTELKEEMDDLILELQDDGKGYAQGLSSLTCTCT